jgi:hypothetical protein
VIKTIWKNGDKRVQGKVLSKIAKSEGVCSGRISKVKIPTLSHTRQGWGNLGIAKLGALFEGSTHGTDTLIEELLLLSEPLIFTALAA